jgi:hypothetical protein
MPKSYPCPKCEYQSKLIYDTSDPNRYALRRAKSLAKQHLSRHYQKCHIFKKDESDLEPLQSEDGSFHYYVCTSCEFQAKVNGKIGTTSKYYARIALARHYIKSHENCKWTRGFGPPSSSNKHKSDSETDAEDRPKGEQPLAIRGRLKINQCPLCNFEANFDSEEERITKKKAKQMTKEILTKHFTELHNPVQADEISLSEETGDEYYGCSLCDFRSEVNFQDSATNEERVEARHVLSEHYIDEHYKKHGRVCNSKADEPPQTLSCSEPGCTFTVLYKHSKDAMTKSKNRRLALVKLAKHSIKVHDCPEENDKGIFNKLLKTTDETHEGYKCYRCDYFSMVEDVGEDRKKVARAQSTAFNKFLTHYILHVVPKDAKDPVSGKRFYQSYKFNDTKLVSKLKCTLCKYKTPPETNAMKKYRRSLAGSEMKRKMHIHFQSKHPGVKFPDFQIYVPNSSLESRSDSSSSPELEDTETEQAI